jgi:hypothetical protein
MRTDTHMLSSPLTQSQCRRPELQRWSSEIRDSGGQLRLGRQTGRHRQLRVGGASAPVMFIVFLCLVRWRVRVTFICVLCTLCTRISRSICNSVSTRESHYQVSKSRISPSICTSGSFYRPTEGGGMSGGGGYGGGGGDNRTCYRCQQQGRCYHARICQS